MNFAHLHLLLNHFPVVGFILGFGLFAASFVGAGRNLDLRRAGLLVFAVTGFLTIPTYLTGTGAQDMLNRGGDEVVSALIERHEGAAFLGLWSVMLTGALSLHGLWLSHIRPRAAAGNSIAVLLCCLVTVGLLARTGNTGGDVRHPEVRMSQEGTVVETGISALVHAFEPVPDRVTALMVASKWWWAFMMSMHFVGLSLVLGVIGILDLRILGFSKQLPVAPLQMFLPWAIVGLGINVVTGMLAFMGMPEYLHLRLRILVQDCRSHAGVVERRRVLPDGHLRAHTASRPWRGRAMGGQGRVRQFAGPVVCGDCRGPLYPAVPGHHLGGFQVNLSRLSPHDKPGVIRGRSTSTRLSSPAEAWSSVARDGAWPVRRRTRV